MEEELTTRILVRVLHARGALAKKTGVGKGDDMIFYRHRRTIHLQSIQEKTFRRRWVE